MSLKNAAILLFACSITGMAGDLLNFLPRIADMGMSLQRWFFILVSLLVNLGFLLVAIAFKRADSLPENRKSAGMFLAIVAGCLTAYHVWQLADRFYSG